MNHIVKSFFAILISSLCSAQVMTPELLWSLGRVAGMELSPDGNYAYYTVSYYNREQNKSNTQTYRLDIQQKNSLALSTAGSYAGDLTSSSDGNYIYSSDGKLISSVANIQQQDGAEYSNLMLSPDGNFLMFSRSVKAMQTKQDLYPSLVKSDAKIYDDLMFRHWNVWEDGEFNHVFIANLKEGVLMNEKDLMLNEAFDSPTQPNGGKDEMAWSPDSKTLAYVCVKKFGKDYAVSTNSDIYFYDVASGKTKNVTEGMMGYDKNPAFSPDGRYFAWTSMKRDGFEADKTDIMVMDLKSGMKYNITAAWDDFVSGFIWSKDSKKIFFNAPYRGVIALFEANVTNLSEKYDPQKIRKISNEDVDYSAIIGESGSKLICQRTDMNHAAELYSVEIQSGKSEQLTSVNKDIYGKLKMSKVEKQWITTSDKKQMLAWVIYPPDFDPSKKYPTLLYCQGGPQSALSQFYSFRWNFQLMAANGYIIVAPNRRGMPGWGTAWNEQISGDWGGQCMKDYLAAIDQVSENSYVDKERRAAVGASFGGYSVMMLAGIHNNRFKTFISHCGTYNLESWYASTEELWFANFDLKGSYWEKKLPKSYIKFSPHKLINKWNKPILIIQGARDYRIPDTQAFEAFTAARLRNLKSRLLYIPDEGHHVLKIQNGLLWQAEFFRWLKETL
ncbi:MAG TPA: S9 family peptidase [Saprospiraceae bacterium]|nr:S9 family peptidase [Saprospiraceae bacterium]